MTVLENWTATVCEALNLDPAALDQALLLDLTRDVAHGVARPAAPVTSFLVGLAAGRAGGTAVDVRRAVDIVAALIPDVVE
jgi:aconitase B